MEILIFKTDLSTKKKIKLIAPILNLHNAITDWCVDREDVDNVLRIETTEGFTVDDVIKLMQTNNVFCEELSDEVVV